MTQSNGLFDGDASSNGNNTTAKKPRSQQRSRAGKSIPTDRMKHEAQNRCLLMYGKLSGHAKKPIDAQAVSQAMNKEISHYTVPLSNGFFVDTGWLEKRGRGEYAASDALVDHLRRLGTNREDVGRAVQPLRETMVKTWFWEAIKSQLDFGNETDENELLHVLMSAAEASPEHLPQLRHLLEWVEYVGLIHRSDGVVRLVRDEGAVDLDNGVTPPPEKPKDPAEPQKPDGEEARPAGAEVPKPITPPTPPTQAPAVLTFDVSVRVTADDLAKLNPEQIQALFAAVGTVMSAGSRSSG